MLWQWGGRWRWRLVGNQGRARGGGTILYYLSPWGQAMTETIYENKWCYGSKPNVFVSFVNVRCSIGLLLYTHVSRDILLVFKILWLGFNLFQTNNKQICAYQMHKRPRINSSIKRVRFQEVVSWMAPRSDLRHCLGSNHMVSETFKNVGFKWM